jgi:hypothetical protein
MAQTKSAFAFGGIHQHSFSHGLSWFFCNYSAKKAKKLLDRVLREFGPILMTSCA